MIEIFLRDRDIDFEFLRLSSKGVKYFTRETFTVDYSKKELYRHLNNGTILINGLPVYANEISKDDAMYIKHYIDLYKEKVKKYKKDYKHCYIKCNRGYSIIDNITNSVKLEVPNKDKFKEWAYITGFNYLEEFINEYEKQFSVGSKVRKRIFRK